MTYATEAALCADFIARLPAGWTAYPETAGFDILLVRADGYQVGIEAKLKPNLRLLAQVAKHRWHATTYEDFGRPDVLAVLLPPRDHTRGRSAQLDYREVLRALGVEHYTPDNVRLLLHGLRGKAPATDRRCLVPEVIPDDVAGSPGGPSCTPWKVAAIKVAMRMAAQGYVMTEDFKAAGIKPGLWTRQRWVTPAGRVGRQNRYVPGPEWPAFDEQHPAVVAQLEARDA